MNTSKESALVNQMKTHFKVDYCEKLLPKIREPRNSSCYDLVFSKPDYWKAVNSIVGGELKIAYLVEEEEPQCWIPFISKTENGVQLVNSMPYYGSHGGPYGPNKTSYTKLLEEFFVYCKEVGVDSTFVSLDMDAGKVLEDQKLFGRVVDRRIGQITVIPPIGPDINEELFSIYHVKTRNAVRKGLKFEGVEVITDPDVHLFSRVVELHQENIKSLNGIEKTKDHFDIINLNSGSDYKVRTSVYMVDGDIACGLVALLTKTTYEYFTPVLNPNFRTSQLLSRLIHDELKYASLNNLKYWNWGGTWPSQDGVYRFKSRWGAKDIHYAYLMDESTESVRNSCINNASTFKYMYKYKF